MRRWAAQIGRIVRDLAVGSIDLLRRFLEPAFLLLFVCVLCVAGYFVLAVIAEYFDPHTKRIIPFRSFFPSAPPRSWDEVRSFGFAAAGLVGAVFGLYQLHNSAARTRLSATDTRVKQEQERNERFVAAAQLLKDDDGSVRMAGVFALERLALEAGAECTETVLEVLSGFIRDRTNREDYASAWTAAHPGMKNPTPAPPEGAPTDTLSAFEKI